VPASTSNPACDGYKPDDRRTATSVLGKWERRHMVTLFFVVLLKILSPFSG
jgi:hypothetical protein